MSKAFSTTVLFFLLLFVNKAQAQQPIPDFTNGDSIPVNHNHDWNLGPTGARGWIYSNRLETTQARQILITKVAKGSPSDGLLKRGDVILGVDGKNFSFDPRVEIGKAIGRAESFNGKLTLVVWRDEKTLDLQLKLTPIGSYSSYAPFDCPKSKEIFEKGCAALAKRMRKNPNSGNRIVRSLNTLALLSSGKKEYLPIIKQQVAVAAKYSDVQGRSLCCWFYGPTNILLAEYTLATGDKTYLPDLKRITMEIVNGQSAVGSWGHRFARKDGRLNGYGMMNAPGLPLTLSLVLARKAGVEDPKLDQAIEKSVRLLRFYVGKGSIPYGDHHPWIETHEDNGKNGIASILFNLLEDREAAEYFSRMSIASHGNEREMGHTGNFFNLLWAMPSVALSGPEATGSWTKEYGWYYDLARQWDGTFQHQGPPQPRTDSYRKWDSTGAFLLAYAQPLRKLYITGKKQGIVRQINRQTALGLIDDGKGYSHRLKKSIYANRTNTELVTALKNWSPVVRQRAADALARRKSVDLQPIVQLLKSDDLYSQLGGCQALAALKSRSASAGNDLQELLSAEDLWLRIKAAEALAAIGKKAQRFLPDLFKMLSEQDLENDPRGMQQRYLCFALFDRRSGLIGRSLDGVDRKSLYQAISAGLGNEDGRARGVLASVFRNLRYEELKPLLPVIYQAVVKPAPSGTMFADGIRMSGLEVLAKHRIKEGLPLCLELIEPDRWGQGRRIPRCLKFLQIYGGSAKELIPKLEALEKQFKDKKHTKLLAETIRLIRKDQDPKPLRSLETTPF